MLSNISSSCCSLIANLKNITFFDHISKEREMAGAGQWISARSINTISNSNPYSSKAKSFNISTTRAAKFAPPKRNDTPLISKSGGKKNSRRRLVTVSTADGKWHGNWNLDYVFSLQQLQLQDLSEDDHDNKDSQVSVKLCIHKHTGFGLSVDGRITTSLTRKCINCYSPYCRQIDTNFNVWVLPLTKNKDSPDELPVIGVDDPSVIYVKPGFEADLDSLIQDTIRLATSVKETCSESCEVLFKQTIGHHMLHQLMDVGLDYWS
ncbi:hypothetical protein Leryth_002935 [Lithospermum erythrorhizon]|nr:hypothetical protein Leryth_002935 [Lithospermum erythrorhizon]